MAISNASNNVFRYVHFTPARRTAAVEKQVRDRAEQKRQRPDEPDGRGKPRAPTDEHQLRLDLRETVRNLASLDLTRDVDLKQEERGAKAVTLLSLNESGLAKLSDLSARTLRSLGLDPSSTGYLQLVEAAQARVVKGGTTLPTFTPGADHGPVPRVQAIGTAHLLVLKQQIKRYEAGEIAHVENVLAGENKQRQHSELTRIEDFTSSSTDTTTESETELESTERFELNKQVSQTFQKDTELGLELTLSGKYGPTVSFDSNFSAGRTTSTSDSAEQSVAFAKDTVERSKDRVIEKLATKQERTLVREIRETNRHLLENETTDHRFAVYQYVDKIYESQIFDYGKRLMFDFMVPEPASYLWYLTSATSLDLDLVEPRRLEDEGIFSATDITRANYLALAATYGALQLPPPPDIFLTKRVRLAHGTGAETDEGKSKSGVSAEVEVPAGYSPILARSSILATSDETFGFSVQIGGTIINYAKSQFSEVSIGTGGHKKYWISETFGQSISTHLSMNNLAAEQLLYIDVYGYESASYVMHTDVQFYALYDPAQLEYDVVSAWKQEVYQKLAEAYAEALLRYQQDLAMETAEAEARSADTVDFGAPPAVNQKLIVTELKKHCLAIIRNEHCGGLGTDHTGEPPQFDLDDAQDDGETIRFLEHAFEWSQLQYVFYPYFWSRPRADLSGWSDRFLARNGDYTMEEFLKAGYARVVVPVREGFKEAAGFFVETGEVFAGLGEPDITDPLYLSIIDELAERAEAPQDEIPVGEPWETRLPTAAVVVRRSQTLPSWVRRPDTDWDWMPAPEEPSGPDEPDDPNS